MLYRVVEQRQTNMERRTQSLNQAGRWTYCSGSKGVRCAVAAHGLAEYESSITHVLVEASHCCVNLAETNRRATVLAANQPPHQRSPLSLERTADDSSDVLIIPSAKVRAPITRRSAGALPAFGGKWARASWQ
jgi:hypothetical protein